MSLVTWQPFEAGLLLPQSRDTSAGIFEYHEKYVLNIEIYCIIYIYIFFFVQVYLFSMFYNNSNAF